MSEQDDILAQANAAADEAIDDLSDITEEQYGFSALPAGDYLVEVIDAKRGAVKSGKNQGLPKIAVTFAVREPESKKKLFAHLTLKGESAGKTKGFLRTLGVDVDQPLRLSEFTGLRAVLTLSVRADKPTDNNIDAIKSADTWEGAAGGADAAVPV